MTVWCIHHVDFEGTAGQLVNAIEAAITHGVPKSAVVVIEDGTLRFTWTEER